MKFILLLWKKIAIICIIIFSIIIIFNEKSKTQEIIESTDEKINSCHLQIESLKTQLTVINKHRKKLDEQFIKQKMDSTTEIQELKLKIQALEGENFKLKDKYEICSKSKNIETIQQQLLPVENGNVNDINNTGDEKEIVAKLQEKNSQQQKEIIELKKELQDQQHQQQQQGIIKNETLIKHSINQGGSEINNEIKNEVDSILHPNEEHKGYADGENVHFHRKIPSSADLEFKRNGEENEIKLPQILAPKDLYKKLQLKQQRKNQETNGEEAAKDDEVKNDGREEVVDYQSLKRPNNKENDYKEMGD